MPTLTAQAPAKTPDTSDSEGTGHGWNTILFNCECHTFDDVEKQLIKAIRCSIARAREISWEVHSKGQAVVYNGARERCEAVASVLEDVRLRVKVSQ